MSARVYGGEVFSVGAAIWDDGPTIYVHARDLESFEKRGFGVGGGHGTTIRVEDRKFVLTGTDVLDKAAHICRASDVDRAWGEYTIHDSSPYICRSHVFGTIAAWHGPNDDARLEVLLPPPHELPFPALKFRGEEENHDLVVRDILARVASARERTGRPQISVDRRFQEVLTPQERVELFQHWTIGAVDCEVARTLDRRNREDAIQRALG